MYSDTVTVFNRYYSSTEDAYYWLPTVIHGCDLVVDQAKIIAQYGETTSDTAKLHIKVVDGMVEDKKYLLPKEWEAQTLGEMKTTFTLHDGGEEFDFFSEGEWMNTEPIADDNYRNGFYQHMKVNYDRVYAITKIAGPFSLIPHLEVMGA